MLTRKANISQAKNGSICFVNRGIIAAWQMWIGNSWMVLLLKQDDHIFHQINLNHKLFSYLSANLEFNKAWNLWCSTERAKVHHMKGRRSGRQGRCIDIMTFEVKCSAQYANVPSYSLPFIFHLWRPWLPAVMWCSFNAEKSNINKNLISLEYVLFSDTCNIEFWSWVLTL